AMEEEGEVSYWSVLFQANSFSDLLDRFNMVQEIAAADKRRLQELDEAAKEVAAAKESLSQEKVSLEATISILSVVTFIVTKSSVHLNKIARFFHFYDCNLIR
ncbi:MAG: hypothetical protein IIX11_06935, partial [Selenomonadales bacterium]|nr:hypothetical protein [Selenomonadales bacterium]